MESILIKFIKAPICYKRIHASFVKLLSLIDSPNTKASCIVFSMIDFFVQDVYYPIRFTVAARFQMVIEMRLTRRYTPLRRL